MKRLLWILVLIPSCDFVDEAAKRPGELRQNAAAAPSREEQILRAFFEVDFAQRKVAHLAQSDLADFDSVAQPRPRIAEVVGEYGAGDATWEADLSPFGVSTRALVYRFGRLGLATPVNRNDGEIFWTLILAGSPN